MNERFANMDPAAMDEFLAAMNEKAEELLKKFFVGKTFPGEPWSQELFDVTMQVIVDITIANSDLENFDISTSIEKHLLFMNVQDEHGNTICDVLYSITYNDDPQKPESYTIDSVNVAFKTGAFVAPKTEDPKDHLPF
jgi:hypothetical protein